MKTVNWAISLLLGMTGLMLVFYEPTPCGEEPDITQTVLDFAYFFTMNMVPFVFLIYIYKSFKSHLIRSGLILLGAKMVYEFIPLLGFGINETRHVFYLTVLLVILLAMLITTKTTFTKIWGIFRKR